MATHPEDSPARRSAPAPRGGWGGLGRAEHLFARAERRGTFFWTLTGLIGVILVGVGDVVTGREVSFGLLYLIPIVVATWFSGRTLGLTLSVIGALTWFAADEFGGAVYSRPVIRAWNAAVRLGFFVVVTLLLPALKALEREKQVARLDDLTGAANRRHFFEVLQAELDRSQRYKHPFAIAYLDLDDFKAVNDRWGHRVGDQVLRAVVDRAKRHLRRTDFLARLGGDEFVLLLPETDQEAVHAAVSKVQSALLDEMKQQDWPVTFSIGVLTCLDAHISADALIKWVDELMYSVKLSGKNSIAYAVYIG